MNESLSIICSAIAGGVALIIAILSIVLHQKEKTQLIADLAKMRDELTRRALLQEDQSKNTTQEFRLLLNQQHDLAAATQRDKLLQTENYLLDKFDKSLKEKLLALETGLKNAMGILETQYQTISITSEDILQQIEQLTKEQQELKLRAESLTKIQGDVTRQLMSLQIDLPSLKEQVKTLETNEADTNIRFSMVPAKLEQIEQWRQADEAARPRVDKLVADLRLLRDLTLKHGETTAKSLADFKQLVDAISAKNEIALRSTMLDKFWSLMDSDQERKTAALKFIKEIDEEEKFVQMCLEFPSQASINALQGLASESDKKDISVQPLYKLAEQKLEAGFVDEARTLLLQLTEIKDLPGETMLKIFAKLAQICKEQKDSEYADVILNRLRAIQKDFTPEQKLTAAEILNQLTALFESVSDNKGKLESVYKRLHESYVASGQVDQGETARNLKKLADLYFDEERYEEAEPSYVRAWSILSKLLAADDPILKQILQNLARICEVQKRPEESEKYQLQLLQMLTARKDDDGLLPVVQSLSNSATAYAARDDYEHAENILNKCITALQKIKGSDDEKTRETVALLEKICHHSEDKEELKRIYKRQLEATRHERSKSAYHARTALKLATLYAGEGEYTQADSLFKSIEHMLSSDKDTARLIDELAKTYSSLARYDLAEVTFNKALEMRETFPHEESNELIASYANLGASYAVQKDYQMAEMMYKRELECAEEYFGGDSENVITPLMHLAGCFIISGRFAEAEPCYKRILETRYKTQGEGHADLIDSMLHLAELYRIQKNFTEAEIFYESACELAEQVHGESSLKVAEILDKRALLAKQADQIEVADELKARAISIRAAADTDKSSPVLISPG